MPPDGKLSDRQIADLARWVKMGLPYPQDCRCRQGRSRRSEKVLGLHRRRPTRRPRRSRTRPGRARRWITSSWPKLEAKGLQPAPPADRRTLIRRATFDLIGLPPTPAEIDAFLADDSPDAFARVVDRLLASPHYGERWGRHWLDVARYADSNGLDENVAYGNAWRYRDYVVAAFNSDKPYDRSSSSRWPATCCPATDDAAAARAADRHRLPGAGAEGAGRGRTRSKMEMDIIDEQIDTVGRAFWA